MSLPVTFPNVPTRSFPSPPPLPILIPKRSAPGGTAGPGQRLILLRPVRRSSWTRELTPVTPSPSPPSVASRHPRPTAIPLPDPRRRCRSVPWRSWDPGKCAGDLVGRVCRLSESPKGNRAPAQDHALVRGRRTRRPVPAGNNDCAPRPNIRPLLARLIHQGGDPQPA